MKRMRSKIPAMIAMVISVFSFTFLISAFVVAKNEIPPEWGISESFAFWVYAVLTSMLSLLFYFFDAILSIAKVLMKIHPVFNSVLSVVLLAAIPIGIFVGGGLGINIYIWFSYYFTMFLLEIVSMVKHAKLKCVGSDNSISR